MTAEVRMVTASREWKETPKNTPSDADATAMACYVVGVKTTQIRGSLWERVAELDKVV